MILYALLKMAQAGIMVCAHDVVPLSYHFSLIYKADLVEDSVQFA